MHSWQEYILLTNSHISRVYSRLIFKVNLPLPSNHSDSSRNPRVPNRTSHSSVLHDDIRSITVIIDYLNEYDLSSFKMFAETEWILARFLRGGEAKVVVTRWRSEEHSKSLEVSTFSIIPFANAFRWLGRFISSTFFLLNPASSSFLLSNHPQATRTF